MDTYRKLVKPPNNIIPKPLNKGGLHNSNNITMACLQCNCTKRDMTEEEFNNYKNKNNE